MPIVGRAGGDDLVRSVEPINSVAKVADGIPSRQPAPDAHDAIIVQRSARCAPFFTLFAGQTGSAEFVFKAL